MLQNTCLFYNGFDKNARTGMSNANLWIYPGYDHDKNINDYLNNKTDNFPLLYLLCIFKRSKMGFKSS